MVICDWGQTGEGAVILLLVGLASTTRHSLDVAGGEWLPAADCGLRSKLELTTLR